MGMLAGLLGSLSIDRSLCACVLSAVGGVFVKGCCVLDVCIYSQDHFHSRPLPWKGKNTKKTT